MTSREKIGWLGRYGREKARARLLAQEVEALRAEAARAREALGPGARTPQLEQAGAELEEARRRLDAQAARCLSLRRQTVWAISRLDDERQREVLLRRFVQGQSLQQVADELGVVVRRVEQLQTAGLRTLQPAPATVRKSRAAARKRKAGEGCGKFSGEFRCVFVAISAAGMLLFFCQGQQPKVVKAVVEPGGKGGEALRRKPVTPQRVLNELADIAFADLQTEALPIKASDKLRALELIYKHLGMGDGAGAEEGVVIVEIEDKQETEVKTASKSI